MRRQLVTTMKRRSVLALAVVLFAVATARGYVRRSINDKNAPTITAWAAASFPIDVRLNPNLGNEANIRPGSDARTAVRNGFRAWERVSSATVRFSIGPDTAVNSANGNDGVNIITFADTAANRDDVGDAIAVTLSFFNRSTGEKIGRAHV